MTEGAMSPQEFEAAYQRAMGLYALVKAKRAQVGERRKRKDGWYVKQADGWVKERGEAAAQPASREQEPSERADGRTTTTPAPSRAPVHVFDVLSKLHHDIVHDKNGQDLGIPLSELRSLEYAHQESVFRTLHAVPFSHLRTLGANERHALSAAIRYMLNTDHHKKLLKRWDPHHGKVSVDDLPQLATHLVGLLHGHTEPSAAPVKRQRA